MNIFTLQFETNTLDNSIIGAFFTVEDAMKFAEETESNKGFSLTWEPFFNSDSENFNIGFSEICDENGSYYVIEKIQVRENE